MSTILLNAMSKPICVVVDGKPRELPRCPAPTVLPKRSEEAVDLEITVLGTGNRSLGSANLRLEGPEEASAILEDLPVVDGWLYLVEESLLRQFPYRADFVTPATFGMDSRRAMKAVSVGEKQAKKTKKKQKARKKRSGAKRERRDLEALAWAKAFPLLSITRHPIAVANPETPKVSFDD